MPCSVPRWSRLVNAAAHRCIRWVDGAGVLAARRRPAAYGVDLADYYRLEAHLALACAEMGTTRWAPDLLARLADHLDARSYLRVLARSRPTTGPATVHLVDPPRVGRSEQVVWASDAYYSGPRDAGHDASFAYPYAMHPWVYARGWDRRVTRLRASPRRHRLFFAGVVNDGYADRFDFPLMTRPAILECVLDTFRADACVVTTRAELAALRRTDRPILLILYRGDVTPTASNHFLSRPDYLRTLARSEAALCPPGVFMPHAHNLIEALAVGTVPLTNYPHFCHPRLIPDRTCLAFSSAADLVAAVRHLLALPSAALTPLHHATADLYDTHLSPAAAARRLAAFLAQATPAARLLLNREFPTARLWSQAQAEAKMT